MATTTSMGTAVGVFDDPMDSQRAIRALREAGYSENQIGVVTKDRDGLRNVDTPQNYDNTADEMSDESAVVTTGTLAGAGAGALWGLGILAGVLPGIGPAIAGGTLGVLLSSAAAGAATAGFAAAFASMGITGDDAAHYETEVNAGRTIVTVHGVANVDEARRILAEHGGRDRARENWLD